MTYDCYDASMISAIMGVVLAISILIGLVWILGLLTPTHSKNYRKYLVNLYVAGRVKQLAEQDKVNLDEMALDVEKYVAYSHKHRIRELDDKIEAELIKKAEESFEKDKSTK